MLALTVAVRLTHPATSAVIATAIRIMVVAARPRHTAVLRFHYSRAKHRSLLSSSSQQTLRLKATVLAGKLEIIIFQEAVHEDDEFAHEDGAGEFFGFAVGEEAQVEGFENWVVA